jgi:hypothetical protein
MRKLTAAIAAVAAMSLAAGAANAAVMETFTFDVSGISGFSSPDMGSVEVTKTGIGLNFVITLLGGIEFRQAQDSGHHDLAFDVDKTGKTLLGLKFDGFHQDPGSAFRADGFGSPATPWNYAVDCQSYVAPKAATKSKPAVPETPGCTPGYQTPTNPNLNPTTMSFTIAGIDFSDLKSTKVSTKDIFFVADVVLPNNGGTGNIGATFDIPPPPPPPPGVPEPAVWGLMILGFGAVGADLRRRRRANAFAR